MPEVKFTHALKRFFPQLKETETNGISLSEIIAEMDAKFPGLRNYVLDDQGSLRKHVNIFIDGKVIEDRAGLSDSFNKDSEIYIIQALSGG